MRQHSEPQTSSSYLNCGLLRQAWDILDQSPTVNSNHKNRALHGKKCQPHLWQVGAVVMETQNIEIASQNVYYKILSF